MEEKETGESEPADLQCAEQTDLVSLIISGEEEATQEESDLGHCSGGEDDGLTNGHIEDESEGMVTPISSPGTSYWIISEGPDHPQVLSLVPGPSGHKPRVQRASRPGLSRIPGRDHRRYYHEYWRSEYLMDFDPRRHGMICMVCGSSLATLKLSTIKRHIRQKHPDSLLWSDADKQVIRSGWESHLNLEGGTQRPYGSAAGLPPQPPPQGEEEQPLDSAQLSTAEHPDPASPQHHLQTPSPSPPPPMVGEAPQPQAAAEEEEEQEEEEEPPGPSAQTLERYLNDSLHAWFRQELLMEYEAEAGRLLCMVCGDQLPSLHLGHIKSHVLDTHPNSLVYSSEEKHCILQAWAQTHEESDPLIDFIKSEANAKDVSDLGVDLFPQDAEAIRMTPDLYPDVDGASALDAALIGEDGVVAPPPDPAPPPPPPQPPLRQPRKRRLRGGDPWRLRLDYLVAYGPQGRGTFCMVCSQALPETKVSSFRRHIQECHPETTTLSRRDREAMAAVWTKDYPSEGTHAMTTRIKEEINAGEAVTLGTAADAGNHTSPGSRTTAKMLKTEDGGVAAIGAKGKARDAAAALAAATPSSRHSHYPGKDQRRNYQVRWRLEYLMDYDCRRHGLICMVCGATLATLKVSTIKRHIQQVHPHSLGYGPDQKQQALLTYNQTALHFVHSDDCFSSQDHGHIMAPLPPEKSPVKSELIPTAVALRDGRSSPAPLPPSKHTGLGPGRAEKAPVGSETTTPTSLALRDGLPSLAPPPPSNGSCFSK